MADKEVKNEIIKKDIKRVKKKRSYILMVRMITAVVLTLLVLVGILKLALYIGGISRIKLNDEGLTHSDRFKECVLVHGIDVSEHKNKIKWKKVKSSGADFAFIRA